MYVVIKHNLTHCLYVFNVFCFFSEKPRFPEIVLYLSECITNIILNLIIAEQF